MDAKSGGAEKLSAYKKDLYSNLYTFFFSLFAHVMQTSKYKYISVCGRIAFHFGSIFVSLSKCVQFIDHVFFHQAMVTNMLLYKSEFFYLKCFGGVF